MLFYHREDLIERFLQSILRQILKAESRGDIECSLSLSFNYQPDAAVIAQIHQIIATTSHLRADAVHILENGFNVGFGAGHNMVFDKFDSDIFLVMNSDVRVIGEDWLVKLVDRFRGSDAVIVGLSRDSLASTGRRLWHSDQRSRGGVRFCRRVGTCGSFGPSKAFRPLFPILRLFLF